MSLGMKIKECRIHAGLSQEQLAYKLCVSRQAVTKWESDRGMPNIESLQCLAKLFTVSVDYLLDDGNVLSGSVVKEPIDITRYQKTKKSRSIYDDVIKDKYPQAVTITSLLRRKKLNKIERIIDFFAGAGVLSVSDALNHKYAYYLVELENRQLLVCITKEFIESRELGCKFTENKKVIGDALFTKSTILSK